MLVLILLAHFICVFASEDIPRVVLKDGALTGKLMKTKGGRTFSAFMGIPYAKPPIGDLRFKPAVPNDPWKNDINATVVHAVCPQRDVYRRSPIIEGEEDCLYLNVYTPEVPTYTINPLPVMVFLHGGGWLCGSGNVNWYGPDLLLDKDIVLVVPNYRLGALGFLSTGDEVVPGNNGLKDQNLALKWIKNNILEFSGDPNRVTIFGESAGGSSAHLHMLSPKSRGLFHKAIAQSGSAFCTWSLSTNGETVRNSRKLARLFKCPEEPTSKMVECLRKVAAHDIIAQDKAFMEWDLCPMIPFKPVIEPATESAFISETPEDAFRSGRFAQIPLIVGVNTEDGALKTAGQINHPDVIKEFNDGFERLAPMSLMYGHLTKNPRAVTKRLKEFYFNDDDIQKSEIKNLINLYTDGWFLNGADQAVRHQLMYSEEPVYYYLFGYRGTSSFTEIFGAGDKDLGTCHADDLQYLFPLEDLFKKKLNSDDEQMTELLTTLWTNFATFGDPTPSVNSSVVKEKWKPATLEKMEYYNIEAKSQGMKLGLLIDRAELWRSFRLTQGENTHKEEL